VDHRKNCTDVPQQSESVIFDVGIFEAEHFDLFDGFVV
jgi:hypothetical protein